MHFASFRARIKPPKLVRVKRNSIEAAEVGFSLEPDPRRRAARADPVRALTEFPLAARLYPLGFPLDLATNSEAVFTAVCQSWDSFSPAFDVPPMRLQIGVTNGSELPELEPPVYRSREHLLNIVAGPE